MPEFGNYCCNYRLMFLYILILECVPPPVCLFVSLWFWLEKLMMSDRSHGNISSSGSSCWCSMIIHWPLPHVRLVKKWKCSFSFPHGTLIYNMYSNRRQTCTCDLRESNHHYPLYSLCHIYCHWNMKAVLLNASLVLQDCFVTCQWSATKHTSGRECY